MSTDKARPLDTPQADAPDPSRGTDAQAAADRVVSGNSVTAEVLGLHLELPSMDQLAFLAGLGVLAAFEIVEWPVAAAIAIGHGLAHSHHGRVLREFGEALEEV